MSEKITISACLIVQDEEQLLPGCLDSLRPVVDEIVVVDTGSRDATVKVAEAANAKVHAHAWNDDFSAARNASLDQAGGDWILVLDADEQLQNAGYDSFREPLRSGDRWGFLMTLVNLHEEGACEVLMLRLFRNHPSIRYSGIIHERIEPSLATVAGEFEQAVGRHPGRILHTGYLHQRREEKGKDERDIRLLKRQIALKPSDPYPWYKFAVHPYARRHLALEVRRALDTAWTLVQEQDPESRTYSFTPEVAALMILDALSRREVASARSVADRTAGFVLFSPNLEYARGVCALAAGDLEAAVRHLEAALASAGRVLPITPFEGVTDRLSLNALSEARFLQGMREESSRLFSRAAGNCKREAANAFFGSPRTLAREGDPGWAVLLLSQAARLAPQDPSPWLRGGEILLELGLRAKAVEWLEQARKRAPGEGKIESLLEAARSVT